MVLNQGWLSVKKLFCLTGQGLWMIILYWIPDLIPGQIPLVYSWNGMLPIHSIFYTGAKRKRSNYFDAYILVFISQNGRYL